VNVTPSNQSASQPSGQPAQHFYFLDALRGLAALWVFLFHLQTGHHLDRVLARLPQWLVQVCFGWGEYGVATFFVLSGFVMAHALRKSTITPRFLVNFSLRRWVRLSPAYYASIVFVGLVSLWLNHLGWRSVLVWMSEPRPIERFLAHLAYLQEILGLKHYESVYWTLCLEMQFYLVFCLMLGLSQWLGRWLKPAVSRLIVFYPMILGSIVYSAGKTGLPYSRAWFGVGFFAFLIGVLLYWIGQRQVRSLWLLALLPMVFGLQPFGQGFAMMTIVTTGLIWLAMYRGKLGQWLNQPIFQGMGQISYSFYLFHAATIELGVNSYAFQMKVMPTARHDVFSAIWSAVLALVLATAIWYWVERPSLNWSRVLKLPG
jgi:peptidoglycan/LPS O-acetylase OafA/YrhL